MYLRLHFFARLSYQKHGNFFWRSAQYSRLVALQSTRILLDLHASKSTTTCVISHSIYECC